MNRMILLICILLLFGVVTAQTIDDKPITKPPQYQYDDGHCYEYQVKMLLSSTDLSQSLEEQQKEINSAASFARLEAIGQKC